VTTTVPVLDLALTLAAETQTELLTLPNNSHAVVVVEPKNQTGMAWTGNS
jgi:hypothetical protein